MNNRHPIPVALLCMTISLVAGAAPMIPRDDVLDKSGLICRLVGPAATDRVSDTIGSFYRQLNRNCSNETRASWARRLISHYFSADFVGHGGPDNHDYGFTDFRRVVGSQFEHNPRVRLHVKHLVGEGDTGVVHVVLRNPGGEHLYEYLSLYKVVDGKIKERWAYGDRNFP